MKKNSVGIIGAGNMGEAIIRGISGRAEFSVSVYDNNSDRLNRIIRRYRVKKIALDEMAKQCHSIVICVKPQDI
ncbi:MAG: NAD(P)-binding domain-containing protein, partial [Candidatus Omnitrophica bacterium]|nr:NAD(P)-binding domain-containing protein [Candidatus Omnitrophota bacterium]